MGSAATPCRRWADWAYRGGEVTRLGSLLALAESLGPVLGRRRAARAQPERPGRSPLLVEMSAVGITPMPLAGRDGGGCGNRCRHDQAAKVFPDPEEHGAE